MLIRDYSMIVATRPDPTVRPPSRYQTDVLWCANGDFSCDLWGKIRIFRCVRMVLGDFVIMVLSHCFSSKCTNLSHQKFYLFSSFLFIQFIPLTQIYTSVAHLDTFRDQLPKQTCHKV